MNDRHLDPPDTGREEIREDKIACLEANMIDMFKQIKSIADDLENIQIDIEYEGVLTKLNKGGYEIDYDVLSEF